LRRVSVLGYVRPDSLFLPAAVILVNAAANGTYAGAVVGATKDTLDCVLCLDTLVLKSDDFSAVRRTAGGAIESLRDFAVSEGIDIRIGLIAYANHRVPDWLDAKELTGNAVGLSGIKRRFQRSRVLTTSLGNVIYSAFAREEILGEGSEF